MQREETGMTDAESLDERDDENAEDAGSFYGAGVAAAGEKRTIDVPAGELTPRVREVLDALTSDIAVLRSELETWRARCVQAEKRADRDPLLGVLNRRAFEIEYDRAVGLIERYDLNASLIFIDVDGLKSINDKFGHAAGDALLRHICQRLSDNTRKSDVVARIGGDEFAVLLMQSSGASAAVKAARLERAVGADAIEIENARLTPAVSCGVAMLEPGVGFAMALAAADRSMYARKREKTAAPS